jgi:hypothetical protein
MTLGALLYFGGLALLAVATLYSERLDRGTTDDSLSDTPEGDWPFVPSDNFKCPHHAERNTP